MTTRKTPTAAKPAPKTRRTSPAAVAAVAAVAAAPAKRAKSVNVANKAAASSSKPALPAKPVKAAKPVTPKKPAKLRKKPVRDSFTMPEADFGLIAALKARALTAKRETKKSELLRAGLHALDLLDTSALVAALGQLAPVKIGRPKSGH